MSMYSPENVKVKKDKNWIGTTKQCSVDFFGCLPMYTSDSHKGLSTLWNHIQCDVTCVPELYHLGSRAYKYQHSQACQSVSLIIS